jgi:hypothetical protein
VRIVDGKILEILNVPLDTEVEVGDLFSQCLSCPLLYPRCCGSLPHFRGLLFHHVNSPYLSVPYLVMCPSQKAIFTSHTHTARIILRKACKELLYLRVIQGRYADMTSDATFTPDLGP